MVQTVVITGASAGIGRAAARLFGARGAQVGLIARGEERLRRAAEDVPVSSRHSFYASPDCPLQTSASASQDEQATNVPRRRGNQVRCG
jgi:NADP-dependent 3-hydroxy acid dehydrogenase YdfG